MLQRLYQTLGLIGDQSPRDPTHPPLRNPPSPMPAFLGFIRSRLRLFKQPPKAEAIADAFACRMEAALAQLNGELDRCAMFSVQAGAQEWLETGIELAVGDAVTIMGDGSLYLSRPLDVAIGPNSGLWYRIGAGDISKLPKAGAVVTAQQAGTLQLITAIPGEFSNPQGGFDDDMPRMPVTGKFNVAVLRWQAGIEAALTRAAEIDAGLFGPVLARLQQPVQTPPGWHYLWRVGQGDIYHAEEDGSLCCHTQADVGILQHPVDVPLSDDLSFSWEWMVDQLPSKLPEHIQPTHDYLSIAIEFDNGLDLTYMWSSELPVDTIFQCPLPWWDQRETHWVLRSEASDLGQWLGESRNVMADYARAIGGPMPQRVVAVWLIANSAFQRGEGLCRYRGIRLESAQTQQLIH